MAQPPPEPAVQEGAGQVPRLLLVLYVLLPVWAFVYLFVAGGLAPPEVRLVARQVPGVQGVAGGGRWRIGPSRCEGFLRSCPATPWTTAHHP